MTPALPPTACCRKCGYAIVGIAANRCPECGGTIDPSNPRTFDRSAKARSWRRRRRVLLTCTLIVATIFAVAPRDHIRASIAYHRGAGMPQERITRTLLVPPRWLARIPYPRWTSSEQGNALVESDSGPGTFNGLATYAIILRRTSLLTWSNDGDEGVHAWEPGSDVDPTLRGTITRDWAVKVLDTIINRKIHELRGDLPLPTAGF